ncbi:NitT/TauT family transport system ATP-binding protein [Antricoccus suffuscus]|uniref:NitT/TauT family transport system ATP-binding protein n=1 Tax=Antricoccus suffuscus TaxID=1629062 RepID=A0A2T0ZX89_9ACTN|nr:ABC transporter ATP-binding protein [Antricoccus suffuscus]PRZ40857.1 NitT/TauT family transport system ATP-binding protein [Antricoccus suffuscus]
MSVSIEIDGVSKTYDRPGAPPVKALTHTDLTLNEGEFFSLVGPSGCGKSTILNMVAGLLDSTSGSLRIAGSPVTGPNPSTGIVFQKATLLRWLTVYENVLLPAKVANAISTSTRDMADHLLQLTGLSDFKDRYPSELSGGMQQRAAIVRALVNNPTVLLMDEPFSALDEFTRETLNDELLRLWTERPKTVLFITHNITEAVYLSDRIGVMNTKPGRLKEIVEVKLARPRSPELRTDAAFYDIVRRVRGLIGPMHEETESRVGAA